MTDEVESITGHEPWIASGGERDLRSNTPVLSSPGKLIWKTFLHAYETSDNGLLNPDLAAGTRLVKVRNVLECVLGTS
jgi:hypothetical protein